MGRSGRQFERKHCMRCSTQVNAMSHLSASDISDEDIARQVQAGDVNAFGELVDRYEGKLKRYGRKFLGNPDDIDDIVQDVFLRAYQNIQGFDVSRRFSPWIYRIAHNRYVNALRSGKRLMFVTIDEVFPHPRAKEQTDTELQRSETKEMVNAWISELVPSDREILLLYYDGELDYNAISDVLRIPVSTVGVRLMRARKKLRAVAEKHHYTQ